jgi:hypothetical protein
MEWSLSLGWTETIGYLGAALAIASSSMKTMLPLRAAALAGTVALAVYGYTHQLLPILVMSVALVPIHTARLWQVMRLRRVLDTKAPETFPIEPLIPYMLDVKRPKGFVLFAKGDPAEIVYYVADGRVRIDEIDKSRGPGTFIGEIALFAPDQRRTATVVCETDCRLLAITGKKMMELYYEDPAFGFDVVRLITARLIESMQNNEPARV